MSDIRDQMQEVARAVQVRLPPHTGFVVLAFDFDTEGQCYYVSNADRHSVIPALKAFIERTEGKWAQEQDTEPQPPGLISP